MHVSWGQNISATLIRIGTKCADSHLIHSIFQNTIRHMQVIFIELKSCVKFRLLNGWNLFHIKVYSCLLSKNIENKHCRGVELFVFIAYPEPAIVNINTGQRDQQWPTSILAFTHNFYVIRVTDYFTANLCYVSSYLISSHLIPQICIRFLCFALLWSYHEGAVDRFYAFSRIYLGCSSGPGTAVALSQCQWSNGEWHW